MPKEQLILIGISVRKPFKLKSKSTSKSNLAENMALSPSSIHPPNQLPLYESVHYNINFIESHSIVQQTHTLTLTHASLRECYLKFQSITRAIWCICARITTKPIYETFGTRKLMRLHQQSQPYIVS